jgi:uncharacterized protein YndB with AHSA1/START domain
MSTTVTTPNELEIRVERVFDAPREHVYSVWTDPELIPEWWGDGTVVEEMDVRPGGTYRFRTAFGVVEGEFREVEPPERLVQTFQNHLQTLEFEDLGEQTKLTQTMRFATTEERDTTMQYGVEEGAKQGFARIDAVLQKSQPESGSEPVWPCDGRADQQAGEVRPQFVLEAHAGRQPVLREHPVERPEVVEEPGIATPVTIEVRGGVAHGPEYAAAAAAPVTRTRDPSLPGPRGCSAL